MATHTVVPAYGRDYKSKAEVMKDWNDNKDFKMVDFGQAFSYINKADKAKYAPNDTIKVRYDKMRKVMLIEK